MNTLNQINALIKKELIKAYMPLRFQRSNRTVINPFVPILTKDMDFAFDEMGEIFEKEENKDLMEFYGGLIDSIFELEIAPPAEQKILKKKIDLFLKQIGRLLETNKDLRKEFGDKIADPLLKKL